MSLSALTPSDVISSSGDAAEAVGLDLSTWPPDLVILLISVCGIIAVAILIVWLFFNEKTLKAIPQILEAVQRHEEHAAKQAEADAETAQLRLQLAKYEVEHMERVGPANIDRKTVAIDIHKIAPPTTDGGDGG